MIGLLVSAAVAATPADFAWLAGDWLSCDGAASVEEHWAGPSAVGLVGVGLNRSGARASFEHIRISPQPDGAWAFVARPDGGDATVFTLTRLEQQSATFENPAHDFPKRVRYWREGPVLRAAADDGAGKGPSWTYRPKAPGDACPESRGCK